MFQESELITLFVTVVSLLAVLPVLIKERVPGSNLFLLAYAFFFSSQIFTVVEGIFLGELFNILEHLTYVLTGALFVTGCWNDNYHQGKKSA